MPICFNVSSILCRHSTAPNPVPPAQVPHPLPQAWQYNNLNEEKKVFAVNGIKNTGFYYTKTLVQGKYKLPILYCLQLDGPTRYNELLRKMETATYRSLTKALKELEDDGLIIRKDFGEIPPKVEYSLSARGRTLEPVLDAFCHWGQEHRDDIL